MPIRFQQENCHIIFDVKMEYFRCKARLVSGGHVTEPLTPRTYASVVMRETVMIAMTLADLNDLPVKVAYIQNAYTTSSVTEKMCTVLGQ